MTRARIYWRLAMFFGRLSDKIESIGLYFFGKWVDAYSKKKDDEVGL